MNLFVTATCPIASAHALDDKRVRKMVLENCQLLCTAIKRWDRYNTNNMKLYKDSHLQSAITQKAMINHHNLYWVYEHFLALCDEYIYRFEKSHKTIDEMLIPFKAIGIHKPETPPLESDFCNAAASKKRGLDFKHLPITEAYQTYLNARWPSDKLLPKWTKRGAPHWSTYIQQA
jgi:hypothetical protein